MRRKITAEVGTATPLVSLHDGERNGIVINGRTTDVWDTCHFPAFRNQNIIATTKLYCEPDNLIKST
jgi:hypothetical protein